VVPSTTDPSLHIYKKRGLHSFGRSLFLLRLTSYFRHQTSVDFSSTDVATRQCSSKLGVALAAPSVLVVSVATRFVTTTSGVAASGVATSVGAGIRNYAIDYFGQPLTAFILPYKGTK
jgi:hypothetical protein